MPTGIAPAGAQAGDGEGVGLREIGIGGAGGGRRQARHVDVVLDREGNAPERVGHRVEGRQALRLGQRVLLGALGDEDRGVRRGGDAAVGLRDHLGGGEPFGVGGVQRGDVEGHRLEVGSGHFASGSAGRNSTGRVHWIRTTQPSSDQTLCEVPSGFKTSEPSG